MDNGKALEIVLEYFTKPEYDQVAFLKQQLKKSERPPDVFALYIVDAFKAIQRRLLKQFEMHNVLDNHITDWEIKLFNLAPHKYPPGLCIRLSQIPYFLKGIESFVNETLGKSEEPTKPKHKPSERQREALYLYYIGEVLPRVHELYKYWNNWSKPGATTHANGNAKSYKSLTGHLLAVKTRVLNEKKLSGRKAIAGRIQRDIQTLENNWSKKVPV